MYSTFLKHDLGEYVSLIHLTFRENTKLIATNILVFLNIQNTFTSLFFFFFHLKYVVFYGIKKKKDLASISSFFEVKWNLEFDSWSKFSR